jgi:uncharacterized caspase-like protein
VVAFFKEQTEIFGGVSTRTILDSDVSSGALNEALEDFLYEAGEDDTIVVFVAGHGARSRRTGRYYFLTSDATVDRPTRGISREQLYALVQWKGLRARRRLLLIDTCHAGEDFAQGDRGVAVQDAFSQDEVDTALGEGNGLYIVAASTERGAARERQGNGVFTRALLDGLRGKADTVYDPGTIDVRELVRYVEDAVREMTNGAQRPTVPRGQGGVAFPLSWVE